MKCRLDNECVQHRQLFKHFDKLIMYFSSLKSLKCKLKPLYYKPAYITFFYEQRKSFLNVLWYLGRLATPEYYCSVKNYDCPGSHYIKDEDRFNRVVVQLPLTFMRYTLYLATYF